MPDLSSLPSKQQKRHFVYHLKDDGIFLVFMKNENDWNKSCHDTVENRKTMNLLEFTNTSNKQSTS